EPITLDPEPSMLNRNALSGKYASSSLHKHARILSAARETQPEGSIGLWRQPVRDQALHPQAGLPKRRDAVERFLQCQLLGQHHPMELRVGGAEERVQGARLLLQLVDQRVLGVAANAPAE